jgi:gas vesicle protein
MNLMNRIHPDLLMNQLGYVRRHSVSSEVAKAIGFVAFGALAGAAAVALLTPRTGPQLRSELKSGADQLKERVASKGNDLKNSLKEATSRENTSREATV